MSGSRPSVALDVTPLAGPRTGIGLSIEELLAAFARMPDPPNLMPYALGLRTGRHRAHLPPGTRIVPLPTRALVAAWSRTHQPSLGPWLRGADVLHATNYIAPPVRRPTIVTVNDCGFELFPETVDRVVARFGPVIRKALDRGATLHVTTHHVAGEVEAIYGPGLVAAGRVAVVPWALPELGPPGPLDPTLAARLAGKPYVLLIGTLEPRKNVPRFVSAFGLAAADHPDVQLVIAGRDGTGAEAVTAAIAALPLDSRDRVVRAGMVSRGARRTLLDQATVLAYPSLYEGFGLPMLEAMSIGVPVLAARAGALPEVSGGAAELADPLDVAAMAAALDHLLSDKEHTDRLVELGRARVDDFSWAATARGLSDLYTRVAGLGGER